MLRKHLQGPCASAHHPGPPLITNSGVCTSSMMRNLEVWVKSQRKREPALTKRGHLHVDPQNNPKAGSPGLNWHKTRWKLEGRVQIPHHELADNWRGSDLEAGLSSCNPCPSQRSTHHHQALLWVRQPSCGEVCLGLARWGAGHFPVI